jgi:hypothetical protein
VVLGISMGFGDPGVWGSERGLEKGGLVSKR